MRTAAISETLSSPPVSFPRKSRSPHGATGGVLRPAPVAPCGLHRLRHCINLLVGRKPAELLLGEFQLAVDCDLERAAARPHIGDLGAGHLCEPRSRTESTRLIVSNDAVFDDDLHGGFKPMALQFVADSYAICCPRVESVSSRNESRMKAVRS